MITMIRKPYESFLLLSLIWYSVLFLHIIIFDRVNLGEEENYQVILQRTTN